MKTKKIKVRQGFTIVELVIVIGVIGVLSAVLIPTFINLNKKAEQASNQAFVKNLNTQMAIREQENGKNKTMFEAVEEAKDIGFDVEKLTPVDGNDLIWDSVANRFALVNPNGEEVYSDGGIKGSGMQLWKIYDSLPSTSTYAVYAKSGWNTSVVNNLKYSFDVGYNTTITSISYVNPGVAQDVVIRTNSAGSNLIINAPNDTVTHYGSANIVNVTAIAKASYHERGSVSTVNVKAGRIEVATEGYVGKMAVDKEATSSEVVVDNKGTVFATDIIEYKDDLEHVELTPEQKAVAPSKALVDAVATKDPSDLLSIGDADALINLANAQSQGIISGALNIKLSSDIDLTGRSWVPFGADLGLLNNGDPYSNPFSGTFDGNKHSIIGLSNGTYRGVQSTNSSTPTVGENYGFIANANNQVTIKDVSFKSVDINAGNAKACGVVLAITETHLANGDQTACTSVKLENISVQGKINGKDKAAGLIAYAKHMGTNTVEINNCKVDANITLTGWRSGGFVGYMGDASHVIVKNSSFKGSIEAEGNDGGGKKFLGALVGGVAVHNEFPPKLDVTNFTASGTINGAAADANKGFKLINGGVTLGIIQNAGGVAKLNGETITASTTEMPVSNTFTVNIA